jgi:REP element-mobilizing transposase RayT
MGNNREPLEPDFIYHIYNHAVGSDNLFRSDDNYNFFLKQFSKYILPFTDVFAYCLMPNHFHFALRIKAENKLELLWKEKISKKKIKLNHLPVSPGENRKQNRVLLEEIITNQFSHFFNSYAQAYNKAFNRMGALLKQSFQRRRIEGHDHLRNIVCYIHNNPVADGFTEKHSSWKYSSFNSFISEKPTHLMRNEVLELFEGKDNFIYIHEAYKSTAIIP